MGNLLDKWRAEQQSSQLQVNKPTRLLDRWHDEWERRGPVLINRLTGEKRPAPVEGGMESYAPGPPEEKPGLARSLTERWALGGPAETLATVAGGGLIGRPILEAAESYFDRKVKEKGGEGYEVPGLRVARGLEEYATKTRDKAVESLVNAGAPDALIVGQQFASDILGPEELLPGGLLRKPIMGAIKGLRGAGAVDDIPKPIVPGMDVGDLVKPSVDDVVAAGGRPPADANLVELFKSAYTKGTVPEDLGQKMVSGGQFTVQQVDEALHAAGFLEYNTTGKGPKITDRFVWASKVADGARNTVPDEIDDLLKPSLAVTDPLDELQKKSAHLRDQAEAKAINMSTSPGQEREKLISELEKLKSGLVGNLSHNRPGGPLGRDPLPGAPGVAEGGPMHVTPKHGKPFQTSVFAQTGNEDLAAWIIRDSDEIANQIAKSARTYDEMERAAVLSGKTAEELIKEGNHLTKEERLRTVMMADGYTLDIQFLQKKLIDGTATTEDMINIVRKINVRGQLLKVGLGTASETARATNALKAEARIAITSDMEMLQKLHKTYAKQMEESPELFELLKRLDPNDPDELANFLRNVDKPDWAEYAQEYWISSVLSGIATHERNLIGNTFNSFMENMVVRPVRAMVTEPVMAALAGRKREHYFREAPAAAIGFVKGVRAGVEKALKVLEYGYDVDGPGKLLPPRSAFARSQNKVVREMVGPIATGPLRMLAAADSFFKVMNHSADIHAQAANRASMKGLSGQQWADEFNRLVLNPDQKMFDNATEFAKKATFNDEMSNIGRAWIFLRDQIAIKAPDFAASKTGKTLLPIGGFLSPFVRITDRLLARGMEYTPYGAGKALYKGRLATAEGSDLMARSAIGSALMTYMATLAVEDRITASAPTDAGERDAWYRSGKQPWSVLIDIPGVGPRWVPFGQLQPIAAPLAFVAAANKAWRENGEEPTTQKVGAAAAEIAKYVSDQSYMESFSNFMSAVRGERPKAFGTLVAQIGTGFAPMSGLSRTIAKVMDPRLTDPEGFQETLYAQTPGLTHLVPSRLDVWGEEITPTGGRLRPLMATQTPLSITAPKSDPLDQELERIGSPLGYVDSNMYDPVTRKSSKLSRDDRHMYQQIAGRKTKELLTTLFTNPSYQSAPTEGQRKAVEHVIGVSRQYARMMILKERHGWR